LVCRGVQYWLRTDISDGAYALICTQLHPYAPICAHARVLLGAAILLPASPYCTSTTTLTILNCLNAHVFIFYPPRPLALYFAHLHDLAQNKRVFTPARPQTPI
jgi:hypothetical protein